MSVLGWIVITVLGLYAMALFAIMYVLSNQDQMIYTKGKQEMSTKATDLIRAAPNSKTKG